MIKSVVVVHGGELAQDVAARLVQSQPEALKEMAISVRLQSAAERPNKLIDAGAGSDDGSTTVVCYIMQTIENGEPTEDGGPTVRFFHRKTHSADLLSSSKSGDGPFRFAVLGIGDSNLLLDRQTTTAKDCNQVALQLDARLIALGGQRLLNIGLADERTGLTEVEPWIKSFWEAVGKS
jgi:sulfite reductase alpha subunit-like flavoprotein